MKTNFLRGPSVALIALGCLGSNLGACSSTSCADTDSCGPYQPPDVCDGGVDCADGGVVDTAETGVVPDADAAAVEASRDIGLDRAPDVAGDVVVREDVVDAQDVPDAADATGDPAAPDTGIDSGRDVAGDVDADVGPTCDVTKSPVDEPCVVDDRYGVFVSPGGSDTAGLGTKASPYASVTKGLTAAQGKNVYVCGATYTEAVTVEGALDGARLFGGFDCLSWAYAASKRPVIKPASGPALVVKALTKGLRIEDVEFDAPATTTSGESSVAARVTGSANVRLVRVKIVAAAAQAGADGVATSNYDPLLPQSDAKIAGHVAVGRAGGATQTCADLCTNGQHATGGQGGNGAPGAAGDAGVDGGAPTGGADGGPPITPASPSSATGVGGNPANGVLDCTNGVRGSNASPQPGGTGATQPGTLTATGWMRADGVAGTTADPGQGGGGGGGGLNATAGGGGGGGCGGCGGAAGPGGQSGGSSFALLSYQSTVTLDACALVAGGGGNGGKGANGQVGQAGGLAANGSQPGCPGGTGGTGGEAGGGGGGAGGHSVAIGYTGLSPTQMNGTTMDVAAQPAAAGVAGPGGSPAATPGAAGKAQNTLALL